MSTPIPIPRTSPDSNVLYALEPHGHAPFVNPFPRTRRITLPASPANAAGLEVVAGPSASVETFIDDQTGVCAYLWGLAGHPQIDRPQLLRWIVGKVIGDDACALREIVGLFVALIDDRPNQRVYMVSDVMGLRPWFIGRQQGRLVCGSDVWAIHDAGLNAGTVNYDAVASWLRYNFDCTGQSLFTDYPQIGYGVVGTWEKGAYSETQYATFTGDEKQAPLPELIEAIHHGMSRSFDAVTRSLDHVTIALSGGYDSRYLAALASTQEHLKAEAFSVRDREAEVLAASMVAEGLGLKLQILQTDGSPWNMYDEPYHFSAGGFPITKQVSFFAASQRPGVPCLNGFIGDPIVRGTIDRAELKLERETTDDLAVVIQRIHLARHTQARFDLLDPKVVSNCDQRTVPVWRKALARWSHTRHPLFASNVFVRQRHYLSNNFLQHMDVAEAIVPFAAWEVIQYKLQNDPTSYTWETYGALFRTYFPQIADVPHNSTMGTKNDLKPKPSHCTKQWAAAVLKGLAHSDCLSLVKRNKTAPRLLGALMGRRDMEVVALFLYRLFLLDQRLRRAGVPFDWREI